MILLILAACTTGPDTATASDTSTTDTGTATTTDSVFTDSTPTTTDSTTDSTTTALCTPAFVIVPEVGVVLTPRNPSAITAAGGCATGVTWTCPDFLYVIGPSEVEYDTAYTVEFNLLAGWTIGDSACTFTTAEGVVLNYRVHVEP